MREDSQLLDGRWRRAAGAGWLRQRPLLVGSVATGALAVLLITFVDRPLALWLKASLPPAVVAIAEAVSQLGVATGYVVLTVLLLAAFWLGARQVRVPEVAARLRVQARRCLFVLVSLAASGALINALKFALGRTRPRLLFDDGVYGLQPFNTDFATNSLPSGHAQTIWAVATALMLCFPRLRAPLVALAVLVSLARVVQTVHYPSDVLVGAMLAVVVTVLAKRHLFDGRGAPVGPEAVRRTGVDG